jgi:3-phytase
VHRLYSLLAVPVVIASTTAAASPTHRNDPEPAPVTASLETRDRFKAVDDADSDDPAIWVNPHDPARSLVVGTAKNAGLDVFALDGSTLQSIAPTPEQPDGTVGRYNNVDLVYDFRLGGQSVDLAIATDRGLDKVRIFTIADRPNPLVDVTSAAAPLVFSASQDDVPEQATVYGLGTYRDARTGRSFALVTQRHRTTVAQLELRDGGDGTVTYRRRGQTVLPDTFPLLPAAVPIPATLRPRGLPMWSPCEEPGEGPQLEGTVVDADLHVLYTAQEDVGIWRIPLPLGTGTPLLVQRVKEFGRPATVVDGECVVDETARSFGNPTLAADAEGLTIYGSPGGPSYLLASSQGDGNFLVFDRLVPTRQLGTFRIVDGPASGIDGNDQSDGSAVVNVPLGPSFPQGLFVSQDGANTNPTDDQESTNFKFTRWDAIADALHLRSTTRPTSELEQR